MGHLDNLLLKIVTKVEFMVNNGDEGSIGPSLKKLESINKNFPNHSDGFFCHGTILACLNEDEMAIKKYSKAIDINPSNFLIFYSRGLSNEKLKLIDNAISDYENAIKLNPKDFNSYFRMGALEAIENKNHLIARGYFREAIKLNPDDLDTKHNLKSAIRHIRKYKKKFSINESNFN